MIETIINFIDENADGCGTDVNVMVLLKTKTCLTYNDRIRLNDVIEKIKEEIEDWDTDTIIEESISRVFGEKIEWEIISPDFEIYF